MSRPKLTKFELKVMQRLWRGPCSIREILETFRGSRRPAYTTVQTIVYARSSQAPDRNQPVWQLSRKGGRVYVTLTNRLYLEVAGPTVHLIINDVASDRRRVIAPVLAAFKDTAGRSMRELAVATIKYPRKLRRPLWN